MRGVGVGGSDGDGAKVRLLSSTSLSLSLFVSLPLFSLFSECKLITATPPFLFGNP